MRSWRSATTASDPLRQRARTYKSAFSGVVRGATERIGAHSTGKADAERPPLRLAFKKRPSTLRLAKRHDGLGRRIKVCVTPKKGRCAYQSAQIVLNCSFNEVSVLESPL